MIPLSGIPPTPTPPDELRPLPSRPSLEFEKKRAKKLVKERDGAIKLAEAQLHIARDVMAESLVSGGYVQHVAAALFRQTGRRGNSRNAGGKDVQMTGEQTPVFQLRALPARPNLEYEEKRARRMVREAAAGAFPGDETAVRAEARRRGELRAGVPNVELTLSEAQLIIARKYGFTSWRGLSAYDNTWQLHELPGPNGSARDLSIRMNSHISRLQRSARSDLQNSH